MSLPVLTKTWQFDVNQPIGGTGTELGDSKDILLKLKNSIVGFGTLPWTVVNSSDSVSVAASDQWATVANIIFAAPGVAHSWIVLKQTGIAANFQMLLDCGVSSIANGNNLRIAFSPSVGFSGGTITNAPTAADQVWYNSATAADIQWRYDASGVSTGHMHISQSTDGQCTRIVMCTGSKSPAAWIIDKPSPSVTGWTNPFVVFIKATSILSEALATFFNGGSPDPMLSYGAGVYFDMLASCEGEPATSAFVRDQTVPNDFDSSWNMIPIGLYSRHVATTKGRNAHFFDLWAGSTIVTEGTAYPADASRQFVQFGHIIFPWDGSVPLIV